MQAMYTSATANESSKGNAFIATGRPLTFEFWGTWDTATITVFERVQNTGQGTAITSLTKTADAIVHYTPSAGDEIYAELSSVGAGTDVNLHVTSK